MYTLTRPSLLPLHTYLSSLSRAKNLDHHVKLSTRDVCKEREIKGLCTTFKAQINFCFPALHHRTPPANQFPFPMLRQQRKVRDKGGECARYLAVRAVTPKGSFDYAQDVRLLLTYTEVAELSEQILVVFARKRREGQGVKSCPDVKKADVKKEGCEGGCRNPRGEGAR